MVGVAGRSKGCHTCRRRKIRCDQRKPTCERCERTGRDCEGYSRGTIFLNQTGFSGVHGYHRQHRALQDGEARISIFAATPETYSQKKPPPSPRSKQQARSPSLDPSNPGPISNASVSLYRFASDRQLQSICLERMCPVPSQQKVFSLFIIAPQSLTSSRMEPVFSHALNALSLGMPLQGHENPDLLIHSRVKYGQALRAMQEAISSKQSRISDQTLAACTLMKQYELQEISPRTADAFDAHVAGHLQLVKLRGVDALRNEFGRATIREIRYLDVLTSLSNHKRGQLFSSEWRCSPIWEDAHDIRLSLIDVAADAGAIYEDLEAIEPNSSPFHLTKLYSRASEVTQALHSWHRRLIDVVHLSPPWTECDLVPATPQSIMTPTSNISADAEIHVDKLEQNYLMLDFWSVSIIANQLSEIILAQGSPPSSYTERPAHLVPERSFENRQIRLAQNIIEIATSCTADECGMWGMLRSAWGLRNAYTSLKGFSSPRACELKATLEECLGRMVARDFRHASPVIQAPPKGIIESSYKASVSIHQPASYGKIELPHVLTRSTV